MNTSNVIMLGHFGNTEEVADYRVVQPPAHLNLLIMSTFQLLFTPAAARLFARDDRRGMADLYWRTSLWVAVASFPVLAATTAFAKPVTVAMFGDRYEGSATILALLSVGYYVSAALGFNGVTLRVHGMVRPIVTVSLLAAAMNLALNLALIPPLGAIGAGIGTCVTFLVHNVLKQAALARHTTIPFFDRRFLKPYATIVGVTGGSGRARDADPSAARRVGRAGHRRVGAGAARVARCDAPGRHLPGAAAPAGAAAHHLGEPRHARDPALVPPPAAGELPPGRPPLALDAARRRLRGGPGRLRHRRRVRPRLRVARGHPRRLGELRRQRRPSGVGARRPDLRRAGHDEGAAQGDGGPPEDQQHLRRRHGDGQRHHAHPDHRRAQLRQEARGRHRQHARPGARRLRRPAADGAGRARQPADRRPGGRVELAGRPRSADRGDPGGDRGPDRCAGPRAPARPLRRRGARGRPTSRRPPAFPAWPRCRAARCGPFASRGRARPSAGAARRRAPTGCWRPRSRSWPVPAWSS